MTSRRAEIREYLTTLVVLVIGFIIAVSILIIFRIDGWMAIPLWLGTATYSWFADDIVKMLLRTRND